METKTNEFSTTPMESNISTNRWAFISPSLLCCLGIFLLSWSVFITRTDIYDGTVLGQYFYFNRVASLFVVLLGVLYVVRWRVLQLRLSLATYLLLAYACYIVLHAWYAGTYLNISWGSQLLCLFFAVLISFERPKASYLLVSIWFFACVEAVWGLSQLYRHFQDWQHFDHPLGSLYNEGLYGIYLSIPFVLAVVSSSRVVASSESLKHYLFHGFRYLTLVLTGFVLPFTGSRTAWIAVLGGLMFFVFQRYQLLQRFRQASVGLKIGVSAVLLGSLGWLAVQLYYFKQNSAIGRTLIWKVDLSMLTDTPLLGKGFNALVHHYFNYQADYFSVARSAQEQWVAGTVAYAFNDFLQIAIEYGLIGLLLFVGVFVVTLRKNSSPYLAVLVTCLLTGQSSYPLESIATQLLCFLILGLCLLEKKPLRTIQISKVVVSLFGLVLISLAVCLWIKNREQDENEKSCFKAEQLFQVDRYAEAIKAYQKIRYISPTNLLVYGKSLALNGQHRAAITIYEQAKKQLAEPFLCNNLGISYQAVKAYRQAEENYRLSHQMIPNLIYPQYLLAKLYIEEGNDLKAKIQAIEVINMPIKAYSEAAEEMKEEMRQYLKRIE